MPKGKRKIRGQDIRVFAVLEDGTEQLIEGVQSLVYQVEGERGVATLEILDPETDLVGEFRHDGNVISA